MVRGVTPGQCIVLCDADNYYMGHGLAEKLAEAGHSVTMLTESETIASFTVFTLEQPRVLADLRELGVEMLTSVEVSEVADDMITLAHGINGEARVLEYDNLLVVFQRSSEKSLYNELHRMPAQLEANGIQGLYLIGDAEVPALIADSVFSGHRLAREIGSANPAEPLPFIRERRVIGRGDEAFDLATM